MSLVITSFLYARKVFRTTKKHHIAEEKHWQGGNLYPIGE